MAGYPFDTIERRWQKHWREHQTFRIPNPGEEGFDAGKPKFYVLDMLPYPSGAGLHVGHPEGYTATDILARMRRMRGYNVLHPMGWDAFGLPAEQYAVETGTHPRVTTERNIKRFREQLQRLGFSYDWSREINTTDPEFVRWTQWIFLQLYERGLAYEAEIPVNWCEELGTALANEEVVDGKSERGGYPVVQRPMRQWMLRITEYAERLIDGLDELDWPEPIKEMQRNWIGRSEGAEIDFPIVGDEEALITAFTTRPDTLFGATYMVLAPEHPLVDRVATPEHRDTVDAYREQARRKTERDRLEGDTKTGVFTGGYVVNPVNEEHLPIWIADYVLATYGTGAIMAVPGQDQRDWDFAKTFDLPIIRTVEPPDEFEGEAFTGDSPAVNSGFLNGLHVEEAKAKIIDWLEAKGHGRAKVTYKLRDWLFSRQRYWGEPFPIIHVENPDGTREAKPLPPNELPILLPELETFQPTGSPGGPLASVEDWVNTTDPETGRPARRETNTMPQWAGSCWYYLRYIDPDNREAPVDPETERYWMPVDLYVGGAEHAVLHLLYARFWHMVLYDAGVVSTPEPFQKLVNQGMILGEVEYTAYKNDEGAFVSAQHMEKTTDDDGETVRVDKRDSTVLVPVTIDEEEVEKRGSGFFLAAQPEIQINARAHKMSKSRGNVVNPDDIVEEYGADSLRLYEMFMGPLEQTKPWNTRSVEGVHRFLSRAYRLLVDEETGLISDAITAETPSDEQLRVLHPTIQKVSDDIEGLRFNTAIAAMMEFVNAAMKWGAVPMAVAEPFVKLLSPFAPHLGEELWRILGHDDSLAYEPWPVAEEAYLVADAVEIAIQVNGKLRGTVSVPAEASREDVLAEAKQEPNVSRYLQESTVHKEIVVPGRLVNFVVA